MSNSMIATIYLIALVVFFLLLVVLTITLIASKSRRDEEDGTDMEDDIFDEAEAQLANHELSADKRDQYTDSLSGGAAGISDETYVNTYDDEIREEHEEDIKTDTESHIDTAGITEGHGAGEADMQKEETDAGNAIVSEAGNEIGEDPKVRAENEIRAAVKAEVENEIRAAVEAEVENEVRAVEAEIENEMKAVAEAGVEAGVEEQADTESQADAALPVDSAFAPEPAGMTLTNEALAESVREAVAMGAAASGLTGFSAADMFGVQEALDKGRKKTRGRSSVPSTDDFFWYNRMDVAEKPSYKPAEMYYHYFDAAKDCIEDLLIEMYDCALVRTEEIRYIAYGIEPRAISMQEILSSGNYMENHKVKEPTTQDLVRIYEKWCGYVDKLFDKVEIHADAYTIDEIRNLLCEFGRNDVDVLLEGK